MPFARAMSPSALATPESCSGAFRARRPNTLPSPLAFEDALLRHRSTPWAGPTSSLPLGPWHHSRCSVAKRRALAMSLPWLDLSPPMSSSSNRSPRFEEQTRYPRAKWILSYETPPVRFRWSPGLPWIRRPTRMKICARPFRPRRPSIQSRYSSVFSTRIG